MKIAVTGYRGRLGSELTLNWSCEALDCDITNENQIIAALRRANPDVIINCAAFTQVDLCEYNEHFKRAIQVNTIGVAYLRRHFARKLIHISTDYIFDGKEGPYSEGAKPRPLNSYGFSKWGGEVWLQDNPYPSHGQSIIVRTTGLYGGVSGKRDFAMNVVDAAHEKVPFKAVDNLRGNQTYIPHLATALIQLAEMNWKFPCEIIHIASQEIISRYEFAMMLGEAIQDDYVRSHVSPTQSEKIEKWIAPRPVWGGLKTRKASRLGLPIYSISEGIKAYIKELSKA